MNGTWQPHQPPFPGRPTVRQVLMLPELKHGKPEVLAGSTSLNNTVRWSHVSELPDISQFLQGGELLLTTGIALPTRPAELTRYVSELADVGISALVIELGQRFAALPPEMITTAERRGTPLIVLRRGVHFVRVTEEIHSAILDAESERLRATERTHKRLSDLVINGAPLSELVREISMMVKRPVILENLSHRILSYSALDIPDEVLLRRWEKRSRALRTEGRLEVAAIADDAWLIAKIGNYEESWGRLMMMLDGELDAADRAIIEGAISVLTIKEMLERPAGRLERYSHESLIADILSSTYSSTAALSARIQSLGLPVEGRSLIAGHIQVTQDENIPDYRGSAEIILGAAKTVKVPVVLSELEPAHIRLLASLDRNADQADLLTEFCKLVHQGFGRVSPTPRVTIAFGPGVGDIRETRRSLLEARRVASIAVHLGDDELYYELEHVSVEGFLLSLRSDPRMHAFIERELGPLLRCSPDVRQELLPTLRELLRNGGNKKMTAASLGISRPTLYQRLESLEGVLNVDLAQPAAMLSLHIAVLARDVSDTV